MEQSIQPSTPNSSPNQTSVVSEQPNSSKKAKAKSEAGSERLRARREVSPTQACTLSPSPFIQDIEIPLTERKRSNVSLIYQLLDDENSAGPSGLQAICSDPSQLIPYTVVQTPLTPLNHLFDESEIGAITRALDNSNSPEDKAFFKTLIFTNKIFTYQVERGLEIGLKNTVLNKAFLAMKKELPILSSEISSLNPNEEDKADELDTNDSEATDKPVDAILDSASLKCPYCYNKTYKSKRGIREHMLTHSEQKLFKCDECHKVCSTKQLLSEHVKTIHMRSMCKFICNHCGKGFLKKDKLDMHIRLHTGEKPYKCDYCEYTFNQKGNMNRHISRKHAEQILNSALKDTS